ncbi:MAG: DNA methylase [Candidatus Thiodiazotropha taylori]|nr:DNA methylase [Candidatus Thiodiazotropha taylori]
MDDLFADQPEEQPLDSGPVTCLGLTFENDEARRVHFTEELRKKLQDPEFRKIEGFPIGSDEDILNLSDPPYYTACPNPWIADFIAEWESKKPQRPADYEYHREPSAVDVSEGKNSKIYRAHSYHTKVPPLAIVPLIKHYTDQGDVVLDAFSGSGMTGLAAQYSDRQAILCDLAPGATFVTKNYNSFPTGYSIKNDLKKLLNHVRKECSFLFEIEHTGAQKGVLNYAILSEVFFCGNCNQELTYWDYDKLGKCPHCGAVSKKSELQRKITSDGKTEIRPVHLYYFVGKARHDRPASPKDVARFSEIQGIPIPYDYPTDLMMHAPAPWGDYYRSGYHKGYERVSDFYTRRNLYAISCMWDAIDRLGLSEFMRFIVTSLLSMRCSLRMPYREGGRSAGAINNLHIPSLIQEYNPIEVLARKGKAFSDAASEAPHGQKPVVTTQSSTDLSQLADNSIDYIFVDPPFGNNIIYSELNFLWEAWFGVFSKQSEEAIVSNYQNKGFTEYGGLMNDCFSQMCRVLKPGRWITVEFHNSQNSIWTAIQEAMAHAGLVVADVRTLDKKQGSYKQVSTAGAVKQDLIINAYKPTAELEESFRLSAGADEGAWEFVRSHLEQLPVFVSKHGELEIVAERQNFLLYDRMVAFHVQRGATVPISATEFYQGLEIRFPEREGMYFLPDQVAEFDKKRVTVTKVHQFSLFVSDEASAIQWLRQLLQAKPQTFSDVHPQFLKEISGWSKNEITLELSTLLEQNFLRYDGKDLVPEQIHAYLSSNWKELRNLPKDDPILVAKARDRWYVPDPNKAGDLEKLREKALLKEFEEYKQAKKKLKVFRLESVRAGFKKAWQERDYTVIVAVAEKIPTKVLEEDPKLLMWYDQAVTRLGGE